MRISPLDLIIVLFKYEGFSLKGKVFGDTGLF